MAKVELTDRELEAVRELGRASARADLNMGIYDLKSDADLLDTSIDYDMLAAAEADGLRVYLVSIGKETLLLDRDGRYPGKALSHVVTEWGEGYNEVLQARLDELGRE